MKRATAAPLGLYLSPLSPWWVNQNPVVSYNALISQLVLWREYKLLHVSALGRSGHFLTKNAPAIYNLPMGKRRVGQIVVILLLAIFLIAPVYEHFDHWDGFPRGGDDTVLSLIATVTFCGMVLVAGHSLFRAFTRERVVKIERWNPPPPVLFVFRPYKTADESPPLPLRLSLRV